MSQPHPVSKSQPLRIMMTAFLIGLLTVSAAAQVNSPVIFTEVRLISSASTNVNDAKSAPGGSFPVESDEEEVEQLGIGASIERDIMSEQSLASSASSTVAANASADGFIIRADATIEASASVGSAERANGVGSLGVGTTFTVDTTTFAQISGAFELFPAGGGILDTSGVQSLASITLTGINPANPLDFFFFQDAIGLTDPAERRETEFYDVIQLNPGVIYTLSINYSVSAGADIDIGVSGVAARGEFTCRIHLGDRDGDGLLDSWEDAGGIDVDTDGSIDIDLPDADPDKKNIYVEVDRYQQANYDPGFVPILESVFGNAPAESVQNPDGSTGIIFRVLFDEVIPGPAPYPFLNDPGFAQSVASTAAPRRGTPQERAAPNSAALLEARARSFRHCVWGGNIGPTAAGWGEVSGDQFIVAIDLFTNPQAFPSPAFGASVFMHELGHNLGLLHGGNDRLNRKPNYFSVMNVSQGYPGPYFKIDYSPVKFEPLNENEQDEGVGIGFVPPSLLGQRFPYNKAPAGQPRERVDYIAGGNTDWDGNGSIGIATNLDLNAGPSMGTPGEILYGFNDWSNIYIPILGGDGNFGLGPNPVPGGRGGLFSNTGGGRTTLEFEEEMSLIGARFYQKTICEPDLDVDGSPTFLDALVYLQLFDAGSSRADRDGDDTLDASDVQSFLGDLDAGGD